MTSFLQTIPTAPPFAGDAIAHLQEVLDDLPELPPLRVGDDCPDPCCPGELIRKPADPWDRYWYGDVLGCSWCGCEVSELL